MHFNELQQGVLVRRYKRFLADVTLPNGDCVTAHCPNTGAMSGCAEPGSTVWLSPATNPKRKLPWTLELVQSLDGIVCVHSALANKVVAEALNGGVLEGLRGFSSCRAEVKYGAGSRADFMLEYAGGEAAIDRMMVEVKAVTLHRGAGLGEFPDAVSTRAKRHVEELALWVEQGGRAAMVFCVLNSAIKCVAPAELIDPSYTQALRQAVARGVEVYALGVDISPAGLIPRAELPTQGMIQRTAKDTIR